ILPGASAPEGLLLWVVLASLLIFAVNSAVDVILTFTSIQIGQRMVFDVARDLFSSLQRRSLLFHSKRRVGDLIVCVSGDSFCVNAVVEKLLFTPTSALIGILAMLGIMLRLNPLLTLLALSVTPLLVVSSLVSGRRIREAAKAGRRIQSRIH